MSIREELTSLKDEVKAIGGINEKASVIHHIDEIIGGLHDEIEVPAFLQKEVTHEL